MGFAYIRFLFFYPFNNIKYFLQALSQRDIVRCDNNPTPRYFIHVYYASTICRCGE